LRQSTSEHIETLRYIARVGKPFEPNTPHHFAFRGNDDLTYIASAEGLHTVFQMGYLPAPFLWECWEEFANAVDWTTKILGDGMHVVDEAGKKMPIQEKILRIHKMNPAPKIH
jgi:hypothetical protein